MVEKKVGEMVGRKDCWVGKLVAVKVRQKVG